jgi:DNA-binding MarR family transcriptional regulator
MTKAIPSIGGTSDDPAWQPLGYRLSLAADWFLLRLRRELVNAGHPAVNESQLRTVILLTMHPDSPTSLARRIGITKQSMQTLLQLLQREHLVTVTRNVEDRRSVQARLTPVGWAMTRDVETICRRLEAEVAEIIGVHAVGALGHALRHPHWDVSAQPTEAVAPER